MCAWKAAASAVPIWRRSRDVHGLRIQERPESQDTVACFVVGASGLAEGRTLAHSATSSVVLGNGMIGGVEVRCDTPEWALECHTGYPPRAVDHHDVQQLCARFRLDLPPQYR